MKTTKLLSKTFKDLSKKELIESYIKENNVVPTYRYLNEYSSEEKDLLSFGESELKYRVQESSKEKYEAFESSAIEELFLGKRVEESLIEKFRIINKSGLSTLKKLKAELLNVEKIVNEKLISIDNYDEFGFVFVEDFKDNNNIEVEKTLVGCEIKDSYITLKESQSSKKNIEKLIESFSITGYTREGSLINSYGLLDFKESIAEGKKYQHIVLASSSKADFFLEFDINFKNKLKIDYFSLDLSKNCNGTYISEVYYLDENGSYTLTSEKQKEVLEGENLFQINNSNVKKIKVVLSASEFNLRRNENYGFLFSVGDFSICSKQYVEKGTYYSKGIEVINGDNLGVDYSFVNINSVGCSKLFEGTSVQFYGSKDSINWVKADEEGMIAFNNNFEQTVRALENLEEKDLIKINEGLYKTNSYIKEDEDLQRIYRGVNSYKREGGKRIFFIKIEAGSFRFENGVVINDVEYTEGTSLSEGIFKVQINDADEVYNEIISRFLTWKNTAYKVNNKNINDLNSFYIEGNQAYLIPDTELLLDEEILFDSSLLSSNNKLFIKADLSTQDTSISPIIDDIRVKVI